jgi:hypothetical protein
MQHVWHRSEILTKFCSKNLKGRSRLEYLDVAGKIIQRLGVFPFLASRNEFAGTPVEAPRDGSITRAAYRGCTRSN